MAESHDWLRAGCSLVWVVDPETRTISIGRSRSEITVLDKNDTLTGGDVLPGFAVPVTEVFALGGKMFLFTIRSLLLLTLVLSPFGAVTLVWPLFAIVALAWAIVGVVYLRRRIRWMAVIAHGAGPMICSLFWIVGVWKDGATCWSVLGENSDLCWLVLKEDLYVLAQLWTIGCFASIVVSPFVAAKNGLDQ
jgi:hypothetical protein